MRRRWECLLPGGLEFFRGGKGRRARPGKGAIWAQGALGQWDRMEGLGGGTFRGSGSMGQACMLQPTGFQGEGDDLGSIHSHPSFVMAGPGPEDAHNMNNNNSSNGYRIPHHNRTSFNTPSNHPFSSNNSNQLMGQGTWGGAFKHNYAGELAWQARVEGGAARGAVFKEQALGSISFLGFAFMKPKSPAIQIA